jgi:hypothetical protein
MDLKNDIHLGLEASVNIVLKVHNNSYWPQQKTIIVYSFIKAKNKLVQQAQKALY